MLAQHHERATYELSRRLKDEKQVSTIIDKVQEYLERQGSVSELCRVYLRKIEHLYYKFDPNVLKQKEVSEPRLESSVNYLRLNTVHPFRESLPAIS